MRAYRLKSHLITAQTDETPVTMTYVKRNGQQSASTGLVHGFSGRDGMDTMSVDIVTEDKGIRTINLCRVIKAWPVRGQS